MMRELRVEDALIYLDQVKMEFGDRPHIYNEFLDIMKTFKTQMIDTPGVIRRVSSLFQGNKKLVLGFNTFLPEGYKIELPIDGDGPPVATYRAPGQTQATQILGPAAPPAPPAPPSAGHVGPPPMGQPPAGQPGVAGRPGFPPMHAAQPQHRAHPGQGPPQQPPPQAPQQHPPPFRPQNPPGQPPPPGQHIGVEGPPGAYGQQQVQHGPPQAMPMQRQQPQAQPHPPMMERRDSRPPPMQAQPPRGPHDGGRLGAPAGIPGGPPPGGPPPHIGGHGPPHAVHGQPPPPPPPPPHHQPPEQAPGGAPQGGQQQPVEFDHAINYVTTIKRRFASEPDTYKKFLEILHTYQKEQRGIKEVLDEVSLLFADHPDLLKEFTYFLPDAVQAQAKAQLEQVAKEAEARKRAASSKQAIMDQAKQTQAIAVNQNRAQARPANAAATQQALNPTPAAAPVPFGATQGRTEEREREIARVAMYGIVSFAPQRPPRRRDPTPSQAAIKKGRPQMIPELPTQPTTAEAAFFQRAKLHLNRRELAPDKPQGTRRNTPYLEFLKCLHLFGSGILNKEELVLLLRGLFMQGHAPKSGAHAGGGASNPAVANDAQELLREFEEVLVGRGHLADQEKLEKDRSKYGALPTREMDFSQCDRPTPSYRAYPPDYPNDLFASHSGQSNLDASVLNERVVCVPDRRRMIWSPEEFDGPSERHNVYEESMFRVEDERFEVDMAIERNAIAMRQVEPLADEVSQLRETEEKDGQPIGRMHFKLRSRQLNGSQINAIARLYHDDGDEVLQHLVRNPVAVLPIVFKRMRQKDAEWRKVKTELTKKWKAVNEANYEGSLDTRCWFDRKELEGLFEDKKMVKELKNARSLGTTNNGGFRPKGRILSCDYPEVHGADAFPSAKIFQPHLAVMCSDFAETKEAYDLVSICLSAKSEAEKERISRIWAEFMVPFFGLRTHWIRNELRPFKHNATSGLVRCKSNVAIESEILSAYLTCPKDAIGMRVKTTYGEGVIAKVNDERPECAMSYTVDFPFGRGFIQPESIVHSVSGSGIEDFVRTGDRMEAFDHQGDDSKGGPFRLEEGTTLLFGNHSIYVFVRLFCLLPTLLREISYRFSRRKGPEDSRREPQSAGLASKQDKALEPSDYAAYLHLVKKFLKTSDMSFLDFEKSCRLCYDHYVGALTVVPKLVERCGEALARVARDDVLLTLFDLSRMSTHTKPDPLKLRNQSMNVIDKPCYRIQFMRSMNKCFFAYVEPDNDLMAAEEDEDAAADQDDYRDEQMEDADEGEAYEEEDEQGRAAEMEPEAPEAKRMKLK